MNESCATLKGVPRDEANYTGFLTQTSLTEQGHWDGAPLAQRYELSSLEQMTYMFMLWSTNLIFEAQTIASPPACL